MTQPHGEVHDPAANRPALTLRGAAGRGGAGRVTKRRSAVPEGDPRFAESMAFEKV
jgi:hypothetical protein